MREREKGDREEEEERRRERKGGKSRGFSRI